MYCIQSRRISDSPSPDTSETRNITDFTFLPHQTKSNKSINGLFATELKSTGSQLIGQNGKCYITIEFKSLVVYFTHYEPPNCDRLFIVVLDNNNCGVSKSETMKWNSGVCCTESIPVQSTSIVIFLFHPQTRYDSRNATILHNSEEFVES